VPSGLGSLSSSPKISFVRRLVVFRSGGCRWDDCDSWEAVGAAMDAPGGRASELRGVSGLLRRVAWMAPLVKVTVLQFALRGRGWIP